MPGISSGRCGGRRKGAGRKPIPDRLRRVDLGSLRAAPGLVRYVCGHTILLWSRTDHHKQLAYTIRCESWSCPRCNEYNKQKWKTHITYITRFYDQHDDCDRNLAFVFETSVPQWKSSVRRRLARHSVDFLCIRLHGDRLVVINNGGEGDILYSGDLDEPVEGVLPFGPTLDRMLSAIGYGRKPIFTSTRWRLPRRDSKNQWQRVGISRLKPSQLEEVLADSGLHIRHFGWHADRLAYELPDSWEEEGILAFVRHLAEMVGTEPEQSLRSHNA